MSLQAKFAMLLTLLGLAVALSVGTAFWSVSLLNREIAQRFADTTSLLKGLGETKRLVEDQRAVLGELLDLPEAARLGHAADTPTQMVIATMTPERRERFNAALAAMLLRLALTERLAERPLQPEEAAVNERYIILVGESTSRNLRGRADGYATEARAWLEGTCPPDGVPDRLRELGQLHELIERIEQNVLKGARINVEYAASVKSRLVYVVILSVTISVLACVLGAILVRRWITRPVAALREAASRISAGDFSHRVNVQGRDELALLSGEVNHMAGMIATMQDERVERERLAAVGEMVRRLAHNLRNPLAGIRGLAEVSRADLPQGSDVRDAQDRIIRTVDRFEQWLKELLDATKPTSVQPTPSEVNAWLAGVAETLRPQADAKGVVLEVGPLNGPTRAMIDPRHLEHAVVAVLSNAIEASAAGERVLVTTGLSHSNEREDGEPVRGMVAAIGSGMSASTGTGQAPTSFWEIRIADQGPGVSPELRERVFKPYFTTKRDGTGIGLAVAQQVVVAHGGRIAIEPGLERSGGGGTLNGRVGAAFVLRLPLYEVATFGHSGDSRGQSARH